MRINYPSSKENGTGNDLFAGYVTWDALPPAGISSVFHKLSFCEAVHLASSFLKTDPARQSEWLIVFSGAKCVIESMPYFSHQPAFAGLLPSIMETLLIGTLGRRIVLYDPAGYPGNADFKGALLTNGERWVSIGLINSTAP